MRQTKKNSFIHTPIHLSGVWLAVLFAACPAALGAQELVFRSAQEAVAFGVRNSRTYQLQGQRVMQNLQAAKYSVQDFLPTFSLSLSETDSTSLDAGDTRTKNFQFLISQDVFDGGKKKLAYDMNRLSALYSSFEYQSSVRTFSSEIMSRYYQYLTQKELLKIQEDLVSTAGRQLLIIEKQVELGLVLETDYLEYLISFIRIENERDQGIRDLQALERRFKMILELEERVILDIQDDFFWDYDFYYYEEYLAPLWQLAAAGSVELKKQDLSLDYSRRQLAHSRRWYLPTLSLQGGVTFSGENYPLTEPKYSLKLQVSFQNNPVFPLSLSSGYGFERRRLYNVNNSGDVSIRPDPAYGFQRDLAETSLLQSRVQRIQSEKELRESLYDIVVTHDGLLRSADAAERTIILLERRLEFSRHELEAGEKKYIDYLEELITLAQTKISLIEYRTEAAALERSLEILAGVPFGGLYRTIQFFREDNAP